MEEQFWHKKWHANDISFHQAEPNALLIRNLPALRLRDGARIFLPLCGKTRDIHWLLEKGYKVVGIELSPLAVEQLFTELGVPPRISDKGPLQCHEGDGLTIFRGNVFDLDRETLGVVDATYDRAALVALPASPRERYAAHLAAVTGAAPQLLVCYDYDQSRLAGPPFSVTEAEVRRHYDGIYRLTRLEDGELEGGLKGICPSRQTVWLLEPREGLP
jgi:thiopurine S-methyltransferase